MLFRYQMKAYSIYLSSFEQVLWLDSDNMPVKDPSFLFDNKLWVVIYVSLSWSSSSFFFFFLLSSSHCWCCSSVDTFLPMLVVVDCLVVVVGLLVVLFLIPHSRTIFSRTCLSPPNKISGKGIIVLARLLQHGFSSEGNISCVW